MLIWLLVIAAVFLLNFFGYFVHWLMHLAPGLWAVHRVHHSDDFVDVTTAYRQHPLEGALRFSFTMVPAWVLGVPLEVIVLYRSLSAANSLFEHMNIRLWQPLDTVLSAVVVTPNMHKVHHSRDRTLTDSNYGNLFALFDRLFGTFTPSDKAPGIIYGLDDLAPPPLRIPALLKLPFQTKS